MGGHRQEDVFWARTLAALAAHFGSAEPVETQVVCVDRRLQWSQARNVWHNAAMRTAAYVVASPLRRVRTLIRR